MASSVASYTELRAKVDSLFATSSGAIGATDEAPRLVDRALHETGAALARAQDGGSYGRPAVNATTTSFELSLSVGFTKWTV